MGCIYCGGVCVGYWYCGSGGDYFWCVYLGGSCVFVWVIVGVVVF